MPSRRKLIAFDDDELHAYLEAARTLIVVGNGRHGYPHPMPMWFTRDDAGCFYCTTFAKSQKVLNWRRDPKAALLVESGVEYAELKGVVVYARCEILDDGDAVTDTLMAIGSRGRHLDDAAQAKLRESVAGMAAKRVALKFVPKRYMSWNHAKLDGRY